MAVAVQSVERTQRLKTIRSRGPLQSPPWLAVLLTLNGISSSALTVNETEAEKACRVQLRRESLACRDSAYVRSDRALEPRAIAKRDSTQQSLTRKCAGGIVPQGREPQRNAVSSEPAGSSTQRERKELKPGGNRALKVEPEGRI